MSRRAQDRRAVLPSQQRRLRHLRAIVARSLTWKVADGLPNVYYSLHDDPGSTAFYVSETVSATVNPAWRPFDLSLVSSAHTRALSQFVVRVFAEPSPPNEKSASCHPAHRLLVEWNVDLYGLEYYGQDISDLGDVTGASTPSPTPASSSSAPATPGGVGGFPPNTLLFELMDGLYGPPQSSVEFAVTSIEQEIKASMIKVERIRVKRMYGLDMVERIIDRERRLHSCSENMAAARRRIHESLRSPEKLEAPVLEEANLRLKYLRDEIVEQTALKEKDVSQRDSLATNIVERRHALDALSLNLAEAARALGVWHHDLAMKRDVLRKTHTLLMLRRSQLISQLNAMYPIDMANKQSNVYMICNLRLPNSDYSGHDEELIATALGHVCHLVFLIAKFIELPLRFPLVPMSSRSFVSDPISLPPSVFPLYSKGADRMRFDNGVFLLNKNIEQLLNFCGLHVTDLRLTLPNLKMLLHSDTKPSERGTATPATSLAPKQDRASDTVAGILPNPHFSPVSLPVILQAPQQ
eukprot:Opistho-2@27904